MQLAWFDVPTALMNDPTVKFLMDQRKQGMKTMQDADIALRDFVHKNLNTESADFARLLEGLTPLQAKVLDYICVQYRMNGMSPTASEVSEYMKTKSVNSAVVIIQSLCRKGYLKKHKGKWRSLVPLFNSKRQRIMSIKPFN
jgi:hypothetical protein